MTKTVLRTVFAVAAGLVVAFLLVVAVEMFSEKVYPSPAGSEENMEEMYRHIESYPSWILAIVVPMWGATAFVSTWMAQRIGNNLSSAIVGLLLLAAVGFNIAQLPYPTWFKIANVLVIPLAIIVARRAPRRASTTGATA
jgi:hypothetical protein